MKLKIYKLTEVLTVTINGKPSDKVYTSLLDACKDAGIQYQTAIKYREVNRITYTTIKGVKVEIVKASIIKQNKGQKHPFKNKNNESIF